MSVNSITTHLRLFDSGGWVLFWQVANEAGFFAEEGISVEFVQGKRTEEALRQSFVVEIVEKREHLTNAIGEEFFPDQWISADWPSNWGNWLSRTWCRKPLFR